MPFSNAISVQEWQLIAFFEVEPSRLENDPDLSWPYNDYTYQRKVDEFDITFGLAPYYKDFSLVVRRGEQKHIELCVLSAFDVQYHQNGGTEWLELAITENQRLELRLKPFFSLKGDFKFRPYGVS